MDQNHPYKIRCLACGAKNRIPPQKQDTPAKCGRCQAALKTDAFIAPQPMLVGDGDFEQAVTQSPLPVLIFFWAPWCSSCQTLAPVIDEFAADAKGRIRVGKVNVKTSPATASKYNILSVPNLLVFDRGRLQETLLGLTQKHDIMMRMAKYI